MNKTQLKKLLTELVKQSNESKFVAFKLDFHSAEEIGEQLSALSNGACVEDQPYGYLVFGVEESDHSIAGASFNPKTDKVKGDENLEIWLASRINPNLDFTIHEFDFDKTRHIALFEIPAAKTQPVEFLDTAYIRVDGVIRKLTDFPDKQAQIREKNTIPFEEEIAKENLRVPDVLRLLSTETYYERMKLPYPPTQKTVIETFAKEGLIVAGERYAVTKLGALLFARNLREFESVEQKTARVILYKGKNKAEILKEQTGKRGYVIGFENLADWLAEQLPANEAVPAEAGMYPKIIVHELLSNILIHQDFTEKGFPLIEVYSDRIEFSNPGLPLIAPERFIDGHCPRNEKLADLMRRMGFGEEKGQGIDRAVLQSELFQLPPIDIIAAGKRTKLILYAGKTLNELKKKEKMQACYQHACLQYVRNEEMTQQTLKVRFNAGDQSEALAAKMIQDALAENLIKETGGENQSKKQASYLPFWA